MPHRELVRVVRGYDPRRSGELQFVPREPNFIGEFRSHSGPWQYVQDVPIFFYGPGHVPAVGRISEPATMADIAPTLAAHLGFDFGTRDGRVLHQAVDLGADPPKLVLVVVWDGGGRNVLARHPGSWPVLRDLIEDGAWFEHATAGSSPSVTPAIHATLGTGFFPSHNGLVDLRMRIRRNIVSASDLGPRFLRKPTLADRYDRAMGNVPLVGTVALDEWHLAMTGRGARFPGGDRDLVALWNTLHLRSGWELTGPEAPAFTLPPGLASFAGLDHEVRRVDEADGVLDGLWLDEAPLEEAGDVLASPAYSSWQTASLEKLITEEGFGADDVPDLLYTNYKQIDRVGHLWGMETPEMRDVVRSSDRALGDLIDILDRDVGKGQWVLALTADHGSTPPPAETGAFVIDRNRLKADIEAAFDDDGDDVKLVDAPRVTQFWLNTSELEDNGFTLEDVARFVLGYTKADSAADPSRVPEDRRDDRLFSAAFPASLLDGGLPCLEGS
jgi:predicted AlkP superfamily pyrophosphatase or phosphodiesterase